MIVSLRNMTYDELKEKLGKDEKIALWTCSLCIKLCGLGGQEVAEDLQAKLQADGYDVPHVETLGYACHLGYIRDRTKDPMTKPIFDEIDTMVVLTCSDGFEKAERVFEKRRGKPKRKIIQLTETVGIGAYSSEQGMRLVNPYPETGLKPNIEGTPLKKVAEKTGLYADPIT